MSVFLLCERAIGLVRGKRLVLSSSEKSMLEALNYEGLADAHAQDEAVACARHFEFTRDRLLAAHPWVFARKLAVPARLTSAPSGAGWEYAFTLPSGCLKMLNVLCDGKVLAHYEIAGGTLLCGHESVSVRYTARITDTSQWASEFCDAFCAALAGEIAAAVIGDTNAIQLMEQRAQIAIQDGYRSGAIRSPAGLPVKVNAWLDYSGIPTEFDGTDTDWGY